MDALTTQTKREIVRRVFPDLRYGGDPDIERYFELRRDGRLAQALAVYNGSLRVRYPDDAARVALLKLYREKDPRYAAHQESLVMKLADKLAARIMSNLDIIVAPLERADLSDALRALKAVESVLARIPGETEAALGLLTRYEDFARVLGYREKLASRALELVREYDAVSRADSPEDYDFIARSAAVEERRRASLAIRSRVTGGRATDERYDFIAHSAASEERRKAVDAAGRKSLYFDPARIKFSETDRAKVEIPAALSRREDKVLAFCAKYWNSVRDPGYERMVFLYSRKFGTRHFEIFRTVKLGRLRGHADDDILSAVSSLLVSRYDYSVRGDLYMQVMWRRLKARMEAREIEERLAIPGPESRVRASRAQRETPAAPIKEAPNAAPLERPAEARKPTPPSIAPRGAPLPEDPTFALRETARRAEGSSSPPSAADTAHVAAKAAGAPRPATALPEPATIPPITTFVDSSLRLPAREPVRGKKLLARSPSGPQPLPPIVAKGGSISDSIRKLSGRPYDVYRNIFLEKVRDSIHKILLSNQTRSHGIFDTASNDAEDQIFGFMSAHYDDPFMDWDSSAEKTAVEALGFALPTLEPIIEACYKKL